MNDEIRDILQVMSEDMQDLRDEIRALREELLMYKYPWVQSSPGPTKKNPMWQFNVEPGFYKEIMGSLTD